MNRLQQKTLLLQMAVAAVGAVTAVTIFVGGSDPKTGQPDSITVDGQTIEFTWTDDNSDEDLVIWTDKDTYTDGLSNATVYVAVTNQTGKEQNVELLGFFENDRRGIGEISILSEVTYPGEPIYKDECVKTKQTASSSRKVEVVDVCTQVEAGVGPDYTELTWVPLSQRPRDSFEVSKEQERLSVRTKAKKDVGEFVALKKSADFAIADGETLYYRLEVHYPANDSGNFFLEAIGSEGGYGHLDPWFDASWDYRIQIDVDDAQVPSTLSAFPVYLELSDLPSDFHTNVKSDGCDIRIVESDEETETPFELVDYDDGSDVGELYFLADSLTGSGGGDTTFYIYYGNSGASCYSASDTYGAQNVWTGWDGVFHMNEDPSAGNILDSTGNSNDLTPTGSFSGSELVSGLFGDGGKALDLSATQYLVSGNGIFEYEANEEFSVMFYGEQPNTSNNITWVTIPSGNKAYQVYMNRYNDVEYDNLYFHVRESASKELRQKGDEDGLIGSATPFLGGVTYDGAANSAGTKIYVDGNEPSSYDTQEDSLANTDDITNNQPRYILNSSRAATVDEYRFRNSVISDAEWTSFYTNFNTPGTFYSVGTQESNAGGDRRIIIM